jgi:hypothetical protein
MATASAMLDDWTSTHDSTRARGLEYLNQRYRRMVVETRWFTKEATISTTVADQAEYAMPTDIEDLESVYLGEERYYPVSMDDIRLLDDDESGVTSSYGVFAQDYSSAGVLQIRLWPVPDTAGTLITGISSGNPTALTDTTNAAGTPSIPTDLHQFLYAGLNADGYLYVSERPDLASVFEGEYQQGITLLRKRRNSRFGSGASVMQVYSGGR